MEFGMKFELDRMSERELAFLRALVDRAIATAGQRRRAEARRAAEEAAGRHGFSLSELLGGKVEKVRTAAKYRNPEDPSQTWSGRGRQPKWFKDGLASGRPASDFAI
jgi:DNA-binding protein H-NS